MTVSEFIQQLGNLNPDMEIYREYDTFLYEPELYYTMINLIGYEDGCGCEAEIDDIDSDGKIVIGIK
jgi:hypothetical protein